VTKRNWPRRRHRRDAFFDETEHLWHRRQNHGH